MTNSIKRISGKVFAVILAAILSLMCFSVSSLAYALEDQTEYVYISISDDGKYVPVEQTSNLGRDGYMAYVAVPLDDVRAIDITDYGFDESWYYYGPYGDWEDPADNTLLQLFIYTMETYYYEGSWNDEVWISGSPGSMFIYDGFWGHDYNFIYYVNGAYPLQYGSTTTGATADQVLLEDGDFADVGMYTSYSFYMDDNAGNHYFADENMNISHNFTAFEDGDLEVYLGRAWGDSGPTYFNSERAGYYVYLGESYNDPITSTETDINGKATFDLSEFEEELEPGTYCIWVDGEVGASTPDIVSSPAFALVEVKAPPAGNTAPYLKSGVGTVTATTSTDSSYTLSGLSGGQIFADDESDTLAYSYIMSSDGGINWSANTPLTLTGSEYTLTAPATAGNYIYRISAHDGKLSSDTYWQVTLNVVTYTLPSLVTGVPATTTAVVKVDHRYRIDLSKIFRDLDGDPLNYKVSIDNGAAQAVGSDYIYVPETVGVYTLVFKANDGRYDSPSHTVTLSAEEIDINTDPRIEIRYPMENTYTAGDEVDIELWLFNVENVKSSNIIFNPDTNLNFRDASTGAIIPNQTTVGTDPGFSAAVVMENGFTLAGATMYFDPVYPEKNDRWQLKWNSPDGVSAGTSGVKVATLSMKMKTADQPVLKFKDVAGTECLLYSVENGSVYVNLLYNSRAAEVLADNAELLLISDNMLGDIDGDGTITMDDAYLLFDYLVYETPLNNMQLSLADVNGDGSLDTTDFLLIVAEAQP